MRENPSMKALAALLLVTVCSGPALGDEFTCGPLTNAYGPFDYQTATKQQRDLVEGAHFKPNVERLIRGSNGTVGSNLDYTLRVFPNHPRALSAMMNLSFKTKSKQPGGAIYTVECYFDRALRFRPEDPTVHAIYGIYLLRTNRNQDAVKELEIAANARPESASIQYNLGLAYFETGDFDRALAQAHKAYGIGYELPGLRNMLEKAGRWKEETGIP